MSDVHLRPTTRPASYEIVEDVLDDADILSAEGAPTPIAEQILAIATETAIIEAAMADEEPAMVAQASLTPPPPDVPAWDAFMVAPPPRRPRFRRRVVASSAAAFVAGIVLATVAVDEVAASSAIDAVEVRSAVGVAPAQPLVTVPTIVIPVAEHVEPSAPPPKAKTSVNAPSLADADRALRARDFAAAERGYQAILVRGGADHEALTGLGMIAAAQHRTTDAMAFFDRALARNASYLPARLGLADALWDAGRNDAAVAHYREIRSRFANDVYPTRVLERSR